MTALEYMQNQVQHHRLNYIRAMNCGAPEEELENIAQKIIHYEAAVEALRASEPVRCGECYFRHTKPYCQGRRHNWFCADGIRRRDIERK